VLAAGLCAPLGAQEIGATVTGTVVDPQGAVLPGVTFTVLNVDTNVPAETVSNAQGLYAVQKLIPGRYRITAALQGFKTYVRDGITLHTAEVATIQIPLQLGAVEENVTVTAQLTEVESNQSTLSQTMENRRVSELPLNGRQVYMLLQMTAGTIFTQTQFGAQGFSGTRAWDVNGSVTIHGSRTGNNEFLIDGATNAGTGGWSYAPPVDAIEEFKVQTASTDASYGRTSGGIVNLRLKSGTNDLRGTGTVLFRGTALDSNTIQNISNNISNTGHEYVDGEGTISGPIVHNRTFFMGGYQGFHENIPFPSTATVPTDLWRVGDFSQTLNSSGQLITIYDPLTTRPDPAHPGSFIRTPFSGNRIPADRISPVAAALLAVMPRQNAAGDITGSNDYIASPNTGFYRYNSYLVRVDHNFSERHRIAFSNSGNWGTERRDENSLPPPVLRSDNWPTHRNHYLATMEDTFAISSTTLVNTRVAFDRFAEPHTKDFGLLNGATLPISTPFQVTTQLGFGAWYPHLNFSGAQTPDYFGRPPRETDNNIYQLQSVLSKTMGNHLLKAGGDYRLYQLIRNDYNDTNGDFEFDARFTRADPQTSSSTSGVPFADFLLGYPDPNSFVAIPATSDRRYPYFDLFAQDDWRIGERATLALGLRWDYQAPFSDARSKLVVGFDPSTPAPLNVPGVPIRGGLRFAGQNGAPTTPFKSEWKDVQPRVSFSYRLTGWLIARTNYGRSYLPLTGCCGQFPQTGFSQNTNLVTNIPVGLPVQTLSTPFPNGFQQPANGSQGLLTGIGTTITFINPNFEAPYADEWMAGTSFELPGNLGLDVAYVGNKVSKLPINGVNLLDAVPYSEQIKGIVRLGGNQSYLSTQVPNPFAGLVSPVLSLNNPTINRGQLLRPYPQFTGVNEDLVSIGYARYKAFELVLSRRMSHGFQATVNYTLSRLTEATSFQSAPYDANGNPAVPFDGLSSLDRTHHVAITALYELPFGPGKPIGDQTTGVLANLIGGWQFNLLHEYETGTPTAMPNGILKPGCDPALPAGQQSLARWFDTSCFSSTPTNDFRTTPFRMSDVRDPAITNTAFSLFKSNRIGNVHVQFRAELFNPFNIRIYGGPNTTITSSQFGRISPTQFNFARTGQLGVRITF
jgi:hypothetical protein